MSVQRTSNWTDEIQILVPSLTGSVSLGNYFNFLNLICLTYRMKIMTLSSQGFGKQWREFRMGSGPQ